MTNEHEHELYGTESGEEVHDSIDDAIDHLEEDQFPAQVLIFRRIKPNPESLARRVLDWAIDDLDEMLADPEGKETPKSPAMIALAEKFAEELCAMYVPWACEPTKESFWVNIEGEIVEEPK